VTLLNESLVVWNPKGLLDFAKSNSELFKKLMFNDALIGFALKESKKRVKFYYKNQDARVQSFYNARHKYPEKVVEEVGIFMIYLLPEKWKNLSASKVANFLVDVAVNLFEAAKEAE
jgi:hypothetical protein